MGSSSHNRRTKKAKLQKKVRQLQVEKDELKAKLLKYECDLKGKDQYIKQITNKYEQTIHDLKSGLKGSGTLKEKLLRWIIYGVFYSIAPFVVNVLNSWCFGYDIRLADILTDFLFVLFAVSMNLEAVPIG